MKTYKAFNKDLTCKGFQYEVGKEYEIDGKIELCRNGFHACESPMEVFDYYNMLDSRFCEVEQTGEIIKEENSTKIVAELKLADIIKLGVEWIKEVTSPSKVKEDCEASNDNGKNYAKIGSSGDSAKIDSTGEDSVICCAGLNGCVKAKIGSWITLSEWEYNDAKNRYVPKCVKTEYVDGERIKADTWYRLVNGEFKEV